MLLDRIQFKESTSHRSGLIDLAWFDLLLIDIQPQYAQATGQEIGISEE